MEIITKYLQGGAPINRSRIRSLAFQYAEQNNIPGFSSSGKKKAGRKWWSGFKRRNPTVITCQSKTLSYIRGACSNRDRITTFLGLLDTWKQELNVENRPNNIWNVDESGLSDMLKTEQVVSIKGITPFQIVAGERGELFTVLVYISAGGLVAPPMLIFKGHRVPAAWREAAPVGWLIRANPSGYITTDLFAEYGRAFVAFLELKGLSGDKHLLLLDQHSAHLFNFEFMNLMKRKQIMVCSFPPHTSHLLQPLDDIPFAQLKVQWNNRLHQFNNAKLGAKPSKGTLIQMLSDVWDKSLSVVNVVHGFYNTGVHPTNLQAKKLLPTLGE